MLDVELLKSDTFCYGAFLPHFNVHPPCLCRLKLLGKGLARALAWARALGPSLASEIRRTEENLAKTITCKCS